MRAQVSLEFLVLAAVIMVSFLALFQMYVSQSAAIQDFSERISAQRVAEDVSRTINRVLQSGNSSRGRFILPSSLPGAYNYTLMVIGARVELNWGSKTTSSLLLSRNVNYTFTPGRPHNVTNVDGGVLVVPG